MCLKYEGDGFCQSVMSHHSKCISSGTASLALSMYIHHINATRRKRPICVSDSFVGPQGVCVFAHIHCVHRQKEVQCQKQTGKQAATEKKGEGASNKPRPGGVFSYLHMQILVTLDPFPHQEQTN